MSLYIINTISASKFSVNGREMFKTFTPVYLNESTISVSNIYDSTQFLFRNVNVSDVELNSVVYPNATALVTALVPIIFVPQGEGSFSQAQIDQNTTDILALQTNKADINHNHNALYYLKTEIDSIIAGLPTGESIASGQVIFSDLIFYNATNVELFRIDCKKFLEQGTTLTFNDGLLSLKNGYNVELSNVNLNIQTLAYDDFIYSDGIALDFSNLLYTNDFILVKNINNENLFLSKLNLTNSRLFFDFANFKTNLTTVAGNYLDWFIYNINLTGLTTIFIESVLYRFDFRLQQAESIGNKQNNLNVDGSGSKYPTVDAINLALTSKADLVGGKVPSSQLPSYVDDVEEYANLGAFPLTGESGKLYLALDSEKLYRWTGSVYVEISSGVTAHSQLTLDDGTNPHGTTKNDVGLSNVDNTSDLNKPISTATQTALNLKENTITGGLVTDFFSGLKTFRNLATDVRAVTLTGFASTNVGILATDTILQGFNKAQGQINQRIAQGGNSFGATILIGTNDNQDIRFIRQGAFAGQLTLSATSFGAGSAGGIAVGGNSAFGYNALGSNTGGGNNSAFGVECLFSVTSGTGNTGVGRRAGLGNNGSNNIFLGSLAGLDTTATGSNNILIGASTSYADGPNLNNQINIGNFLYKTSIGNFGIDINGATEKLHVNGGLRVTGAYKDSSNLGGTSGQILSSTGTGTAWGSLKTINGETLLGAGDIVISGGGGSGLSQPQTMARISIGF